eukprot:jgi/Psemu1/57800/gm1.57800_g
MSKETGSKGNAADVKLGPDTDKKPWGKGKETQGKKNNEYDNNWFQDGTAGLEDHIFYYGKGMNTEWMTSKEKLLHYVRQKYTTSSMSEAVSLEPGVNRIRRTAESTFKTIETEKDGPKLFGFVTQICNRTSLIDHKPTTIVMRLFSITELHGGKMHQRLECYTHFAGVEWRKAAKLAGLDPS